MRFAWAVPTSAQPRLPDIAALRAAVGLREHPVGGRNRVGFGRRPAARRPRRNRRSGSGVPWLVAVGIPLLATTVLAAALWLSGRGSAPESAGGAPAAGSPGAGSPGAGSPAAGAAAPHGAADWLGTLAELDARRSAAFAAADPSVLGQVYVAGSPALDADADRIGELRATGVVARGFRLTVTSVVVYETGPGRVVLRVTDWLGPYELVDISGAVVAHREGRGERSWLLTLVPAGPPSGEWRIASIEDATEGTR